MKSLTIPCRMKQQASPCDHNIEKIVHSHDHKVCETLAKVYAMPIDLQWEVQSEQQELHREWFQGCQDLHFHSCPESYQQLQKGDWLEPFKTNAQVHPPLPFLFDKLSTNKLILKKGNVTTIEELIF